MAHICLRWFNSVYDSLKWSRSVNLQDMVNGQLWLIIDGEWSKNALSMDDTTVGGSCWLMLQNYGLFTTETDMVNVSEVISMVCKWSIPLPRWEQLHG